MSGPQPLLPSDPTSFGTYSVTGRLGKGGQGTVYLAQDPDGEEVAIKVLNDNWAEDDDLRKRFEKEVRAAQKVASFCTSAVHEANLDENPPYVVSEFVPGPSLQEAVATDGPRKGASLQRLAVSTATALVAIHQAGIVHRDFKPGNVLLGPDGPRVIDFGIARVDDGTATMTNSIVGTPSYMSPEQIEGTGITDKADIFAWGCVMAFASTGNAPFGSDSVPAVVHRVVSAPPNIEGITGPLRAIIENCLDKDAGRRPSAQQLLLRLLGHETGTAEAPSTDEIKREGEQRAAAAGPISGPHGPYYTPAPHSGPQTPFPQQHPGTGPQRGGFTTPMPQQRPMAPPQGMPSQHLGRAPGHNPNVRPPMTGPNTMYGPGGLGPQHTMQPQQRRPEPRVEQEDPLLSQGWVVPAVLIAIIILLLLLVLVSLSGS